MRTHAQGLSSVCPHHDYDVVGAQEILPDGVSQYRDIRANQAHLWYFELGPPWNVTIWDQPNQDRKFILNLEPCRGVVYMFVRKTRPCYPDPYSCVESKHKYDC